MIDKRIERLEVLRDEIFDLANSFAGDKTGVVAGELHEASNRITKSVRMLNEGIKPEDERQQLAEWFAKQPGLMQLLSQRD